MLVPYLTEVYTGLINRQTKEYIGVVRMKHYLNLPEIIGERLINQINANGDERIDYDEFVPFFLNLLVGNLEQKMLIAFKCYDIDGDEEITEDEVKIILRNIPVKILERYGYSHSTNHKGISSAN